MLLSHCHGFCANVHGMNNVVAAEIRATMARQEVSAQELATRLGVSKMWVSRRTSGQTRLTLDDVARIAAALEVDSAQLLNAPTT